MAFDLSRVGSSKSNDPPCIVIYGERGEGKTSLAASFPNPILVNMEKGTPVGVDVPSTGLLSSYQEVREVMAALYSQEHSYRTVIFDTIDVMEGLVQAFVCAEKGWESIESADYGKGYVYAKERFVLFMQGVNQLKERGMCVVLLAHSLIRAFRNPAGEDYFRFDLGLHRDGKGIGPAGVVCDLADAVLFLRTEVETKDKKAKSSGMRYLNTQPNASFVAKNPWEMPSKVFVPKEDGYAAVAQYLPNMPPVQVVSNQENPSEKEAA